MRKGRAEVRLAHLGKQKFNEVREVRQVARGLEGVRLGLGAGRQSAVRPLKRDQAFPGQAVAAEQGLALGPGQFMGQGLQEELFGRVLGQQHRGLATAHGPQGQGQGVQGVGEGQGSALAAQGGQALGQFARSAAGEGDHGQGFGRCALGQQALHAAQQGVGLARARPGQHQRGAGTGAHGGLLGRVQAACRAGLGDGPDVGLSCGLGCGLGVACGVRLGVGLGLGLGGASARGAGRHQPPAVAHLGALLGREHGDDPELAVKAGLAQHLARAHALHGLGQHRRGPADVRQGRVAQDEQLRAQGGDEAEVFLGDLLGARAHVEHLGEHLTQGDERIKAGLARRLHGLGPVGQGQHPVQHAQGGGPAADRAQAPVGHGLAGLHGPVALAVPVQVVLALLREELHRAQKFAVARHSGLVRAQGLADAGEAGLAPEQGGLARQLLAGVRVGVGDHAKAVER